MVVDQEGFQQIDLLIEKEKERLKQAVKAKASAYQEDTNSWHDNAAYDDAIEKETGAIMEINRLIDTKNTVEIISKHNNSSLVDIGNTVTIEMNNDDVFDVVLTGKFLANSKAGEITLNSPLGKAIYKKKIGDEVSFVANNNKCFIKILNFQNKEN